MRKDEDGFRAFVAARSPALARTAYLLTGDAHHAEDLLQEALARCAARWPKLVRGGDPEPYVRRVIYTCAVDGWRRRRPAEVLDDEPADTPSPGDHAESVARRVVLRDALAMLTTHQRAVLVLRFYEDRTEAQTAATLGCSVNTVKSQTRHALMRLRTLAPDLAETFGHAMPDPVEVQR
jgi:RNA polymerase sigma-70 factor (sigma-E family)